MALIFSSCSTIKNELGLSDKAGITYNKLTESEKNLDADLKAIAKNKPLADLLNDSNSAEPLVKDGKVTATYRASWANIKMRTLSIREVRMKNKMKITKADEKKALTDAKSLFSGSDSAASDDIWKAFPKSFQDRLVESFAEQYALLRAAPEVTDKEIKKYYDENQSTIAAPCESGKVISHILVAEEADANDLKADIDGGADFAKLAKENSTDPGSKDKGGDLGFFTPGNFVAEFETAATNLAVGDVSEVVKT